MGSRNKLVHPIFILSIFTLIVNDFFLKAIFHNNITGKLSDFAGLFAFPFFWSAIFPQKTKAVHFVTTALFLFWKSEFSQPLIDFINIFGLKTFRTIDYADYITLISVLFSYLVIHQPFRLEARPFFLKLLFFISLFGFVATTQKRESPTVEEEFKTIDIHNQGIVALDVVIDFRYSKEEMAADTNNFNPKDSFRMDIIERYNIIDTFRLASGKSERRITPIFQDSTKFPASFKVTISDTLGKVLKQYTKAEFLKAVDTNSNGDTPNQYSNYWNLKVGKKQPEKLQRFTIYGRWKTESSAKKQHTFEIRDRYYYDVDPDSDLAKYEIRDSTVIVSYPKMKRQGRVLKLDGRNLTINWDDKGIVNYQKLYD